MIFRKNNFAKKHLKTLIMTSKQTTLYSSGTVKRDDPYSDDDAKEETKAIRKEVTHRGLLR